MKRTLLLAALAASAGAVGTGAASAQVAVGVGLGTGGISGEVQIKVAPWLQIRGGYNYFEYTAEDQTYEDITFGGNVDLTSVGVFADLHPFSNSFVISGGALMFQGDDFLSLTAVPQGTYNIDGVNRSAAEVGTLGFAGSFEQKTAPYLGLGWDTTGGGGIGLKLLLGAAFTGTPTVDLTSTGGTASNNATFQQQLANEEQSMNSEIEEYKIIPVVQFGITLGF